MLPNVTQMAVNEPKVLHRDPKVSPKGLTRRPKEPPKDPQKSPKELPNGVQSPKRPSQKRKVKHAQDSSENPAQEEKLQ